MENIIWAVIVVNALINMRIGILEFQDGEDRVKARQVHADEVLCWSGAGVSALVAWVVFSPIVTIVWLTKKLLFPRGIKSKFAKEQEAKKAKEEAERALQEMEEERKRLFLEAQAILVDWAPGSLVTSEPEQHALGWEAAADVFDAAADQVRRDKGKPWTPSGPKDRIRAMVSTPSHGRYADDPYDI